MFRGKALRLEVLHVAANFHMKALSSKRRSFACIFQVVESLSTPGLYHAYSILYKSRLT